MSKVYPTVNRLKILILNFLKLKNFVSILLDCLSLFKLNIASEIEELILNSRQI